MAKLLRFSPYNEHWEDAFKELEAYLIHILRGYYIDIHHVGSTSVKGLGAKPIIDIDIEYETNLDSIIQILEKHGWIYEGEKGITNRHAFRRTDTLYHEHHLYAIPKGDIELQKHITLRNGLRNYPKLKRLYHQTKQQLIIQNNQDRERYTESKTDIITYIMKVSENMKRIIFAGGCFWGVEAYFKQLEGVHNTDVGYIGALGDTNYKEVCSGSGHAEAVQIDYDPETITLERLLDHLFNIIDPTSINKQGPDIGVQYRSGIYNYTEEEQTIINKYFEKRQPEYNKPIMIELKDNQTFYPAEEYHQDYLDKNKNGYCHVKLDSYKNV